MKFKTARILFLGDVFATAVTQLLKHPFIKWMQYELHSGTFYKCKITRITQTWLQIGHWRHTGWRAGRISLQRYKTSWKRDVACFTTYVKNCLETLKSSCCELRWSPYLGFESCSRRTFSGRDSRPLVLLLVIAELKVLLAVFRRRRSCSARR